jgi:hypothetical protein
MTTVMLIAGGAISTGGLTAFAVKRFFSKNRPKTSNKRIRRITK